MLVVFGKAYLPQRASNLWVEPHLASYISQSTWVFHYSRNPYQMFERRFATVSRTSRCNPSSATNAPSTPSSARSPVARHPRLALHRPRACRQGDARADARAGGELRGANGGSGLRRMQAVRADREGHSFRYPDCRHRVQRRRHTEEGDQRRPGARSRAQRRAQAVRRTLARRHHRPRRPPLDRRTERLPEDARGATAAGRLRADRDERRASPADGPLALPARRVPARTCRHDRAGAGRLREGRRHRASVGEAGAGTRRLGSRPRRGTRRCSRNGARCSNRPRRSAR